MICVFRYYSYLQLCFLTYFYLQDCDKILSTEHTMIKPLVLKGDALYELGNLEEAKAVYNTALLVDPDNENAWTGVRNIERLQQRLCIVKCD